MAISTEALELVDSLLGTVDPSPAALSTLRQQLPGITVTQCAKSDVDMEEPFREYQSFTLYLVDGADHCWRLTSDPGRATGLIVASNRGAA
ncbi:MAG: hypothetical protein ACLPID_19625 [Beijerinckiaceae bacterium]